VLTFPGETAMPGLVAARPARRLSTGTARSWTLAGQTAPGRPSAGRPAQPEGEGDAVLFADAPLVVRDVPGERVCQTRAGQRCGRWSAPLRRMPIRPRLAGVQFLRLAGLSGWRQSGRSRDDFGRPGRSVYRRQTREPARQQPWEAICAT